MFSSGSRREPDWSIGSAAPYLPMFPRNDAVVVGFSTILHACLTGQLHTDSLLQYRTNPTATRLYFWLHLRESHQKPRPVSGGIFIPICDWVSMARHDGLSKLRFLSGSERASNGDRA